MDNKTYLSIGDHIQRQYGERWELSVDDLLKSLRSEKYAVERNEVVSLFQRFEKNGLGSFITGRRGKPSRMRWRALPKNLSFEVATTTARLLPSAEMLEYPFVLRPGVTAKFVLPADLSTQEAARVAGFVQQLPVDGGKEAAAG